MKNTALLSNISESKTKATITVGNKVEIIEIIKEYFLVVIPNGESGWVSQSDIEDIIYYHKHFCIFVGLWSNLTILYEKSTDTIWIISDYFFT